MTLLQQLTEAALRGEPASVDDAMRLDAECADTDALCDAADRIRRHHCGDRMDTCSIINARSGRCTEDCKWCSQSMYHHTGVNEYDAVDTDTLLESARRNTERGVARFSMVTSGRRVSRRDIERFCDMYRQVRATTPIYLCASMGLIDRESMQRLYDAGVRRYHCNLETSRGFFGTLCSTHSHDDKLRTIGYALECGMEVCSGGIIGMGETLRDRLEMVDEARRAGAASVPVNLLNPIKGTPLQDVPLLPEHDIIRTVALMRFVAPTLVLRFAGGRARLSAEANRRILRGGMNGTMIGDLLTTAGNEADSDFNMFAELGYTV